MLSRPLVMIPGPVEVEPDVLAAHAAPPRSHLDPAVIAAFGRALGQLRALLGAPDGQPFVLAGSGTLAMDAAAANLVERGDRALVVNTGYFGDRFGAILERYGADVRHVGAPVGGAPAPEEVARAAAAAPPRVVTVTQVDTSTGVRADVRGIAAALAGSGALLVVDGVCSAAGEDLRMQEWGLDVAFTASQKAVGVPPGLALLVARPRAMEAFRARRSPVPSYYADWTNWLPVMEAYEAGRPAYFGTPAVNLVMALDVALAGILREGLDARVARHAALARACRAAVRALGLGQVPLSDAVAAHTMTAPRVPPGVEPAALCARVRDGGAVIAGGLHPAIRNAYVRIGHMGGTTPGELLATLGALESGLAACGHAVEPGAALAAAARALSPA